MMAVAEKEGSERAEQTACAICIVTSTNSNSSGTAGEGQVARACAAVRAGQRPG